MRPGMWQLVVLVVVVLLVFGARRLPMIAKNVGQSLKIFKKEVQELTADDDPEAPVATPGSSSDTPKEDQVAQRGED